MTTFRILDKSTPPPGGWYWVEPSTQRIFKHYARDAFFQEIRDHRLRQGIPIEPGWEERIEDEICRNNPHWGREVCGRTERYGERRPVSLAAMQSFLNVVGHWVAGILHGKEVFVSQEEAEKRAEICASCDLNVNIAGSCGACADRIARALAVIGSRRTKLDEKLGACSICSCALRAAVHVPIEPQIAGLSEELKEDFRKVSSYCWKAQGL